MSEPAQSIPMWQTIVALLGLGSWGATWLAYWLNSRLEREKWINDNKKLEWRELIDEMDRGLAQMTFAFASVNVISMGDDSNNPMAGTVRGNRAITSRIFIVSALKKHGLLDKREDLTQYVGSASNPPSAGQTGRPTHYGFHLKANDFRDELLRVAQKDLGVN
jgi:hypothetical protein